MLILFILYVKNYKRQMLSVNCKHVQYVKIDLPCNFEVNLITHFGVIDLLPTNFQNCNTFRPLFKSCKRYVLSLNCKHVQHVKIYLPWNLQVNPINHLGVIALFSSKLKKILILFILYFKNYQRQMLSSTANMFSMSRSIYPAILK